MQRSIQKFAQSVNTTPPKRMVYPEVTERGRPEKDSVNNFRAFLRYRGIETSFDAFERQAYITEPGRDPVPLDDVVVSRFLVACNEERFHIRDTLLARTINTDAREDIFNPVADYLDSLEWDGVPRLDRALTTYAGAEDTELTRAFFGKWMIGAVRRVRVPGTKCDAMLVLEGRQGVRKSSFFRALAGADRFTDAVSLGMPSKEIVELTGGVWIVEISDLVGRKSEVESIKAMLSRTHDVARLAYDKSTSKLPRQFMIAGTTNEGEYLKDVTGNRRFWPVRVEEIDLAAVNRDRDQLWAEAAYRESDGEGHELPEGLWEAAAIVQEARRERDVWEDDLAEAFGDAATGSPGYVTRESVWTRLGVNISARTPASGARVKRAMEKLGFVDGAKMRVAGVLVRVWVRGDDRETPLYAGGVQ